MPNWCENHLTVTGPEGVVDRFVKRVRCGKAPFSFNRLVPVPREIKRICTDGADNWLDWCVANWGTKWDACEAVRLSHKPGIVEYRFDTAWGPPDGWLERVADMFPALAFEIEYEVEGGLGNGTETYRGRDQLLADLQKAKEALLAAKAKKRKLRPDKP